MRSAAESAPRGQLTCQSITVFIIRNTKPGSVERYVTDYLGRPDYIQSGSLYADVAKKTGSTNRHLLHEQYYSLGEPIY